MIYCLRRAGGKVRSLEADGPSASHQRIKCVTQIATELAEAGQPVRRVRQLDIDVAEPSVELPGDVRLLEELKVGRPPGLLNAAMLLSPC